MFPSGVPCLLHRADAPSKQLTPLLRWTPWCLTVGSAAGQSPTFRRPSKGDEDPETGGVLPDEGLLMVLRCHATDVICSKTTLPSRRALSALVACDLERNATEQAPISADLEALQEQLHALQRDHGVLRMSRAAFWHRWLSGHDAGVPR